MKFLSVFTFLTIATMALAYPNELPAPDSPERTQACCYKVDKDRCADGTAGTPFCGYGPCNIFGCACEGGCRRRK